MPLTLGIPRVAAQFWLYDGTKVSLRARKKPTRISFSAVRAEKIRGAGRRILLGERRVDSGGAVEHSDLHAGRSLKSVLMVVGVAAVHLELRVELMVDATGVVFEEGARGRIVREIADRPGAAE